MGNLSQAEEFKFETSKIEIIDSGNLISAEDGKALSSDGNLEIIAKKFELNKIDKTLKAFKGIAFFKLDNLKIEFDEIILNQSTLITTAKKNVKILDLSKNILIQTDFISFDKEKKILESYSPSFLKDNNNNLINTESFNYNLNDGIIKLEKVVLKDFNNNNFKIDFAFLNTLSKKLIGNDVSIDLNNQSFDKENEPRLKGKSIKYKNGISETFKGVFTTCKRNDKCPPWQLSAEKIQHNPDNQTVNYKMHCLKFMTFLLCTFQNSFIRTRQ